MNEQQNTALVQKLYDSFGKGDLQTILNSLAEDVEWTLEGPEIIPFAGKRKGVAEVTKFFEALATTVKESKLTTEQFVAQGDVVATLGRFAGTVKATGKSLEAPVAHFFTIRNGKVSRFVDLTNTAAIAAAYQSASAASK
jgi:ketosteroid isomerase-like protein